jgi:hypothetical protein
LRGEPATEAVRWEEDYWEIFVTPGDQVVDAETRIISFGALLGHDPSLEAVAGLSVGSGVFRRAGEEWQVWKRR